MRLSLRAAIITLLVVSAAVADKGVGVLGSGRPPGHLVLGLVACREPDGLALVRLTPRNAEPRISGLVPGRSGHRKGRASR